MAYIRAVALVPVINLRKHGLIHYFNGLTVGLWGWIRNFIPHFIMGVIYYPCCVANLERRGCVQGSLRSGRWRSTGSPLPGQRSSHQPGWSSYVAGHREGVYSRGCTSGNTDHLAHEYWQVTEMVRPKRVYTKEPMVQRSRMGNEKLGLHSALK